MDDNLQLRLIPYQDRIIKRKSRKYTKPWKIETKFKNECIPLYWKKTSFKNDWITFGRYKTYNQLIQAYNNIVDKSNRAPDGTGYYSYYRTHNIRVVKIKEKKQPK